MKAIVTGASGLLGADIARVFQREYDVVALQGRKELDITNAEKVMDYFNQAKPDVIIHCAGFRMVDEAEQKPEMTLAVNALGSKNVALAAEELGIPMVHISSDSVFDGETNVAYNEYDKLNPVNVYGYSKMMAEKEVSTFARKHYIVRVPLLFGALGHPESNYIVMMAEKIKNNETLMYTTDQLCSPTYTKDVGEAILEMIKHPYYGVYHLANTGEPASRYGFYKKCAELLGLPTDYLKPTLQQAKLARRSKNTMFSSIAFKNSFNYTFRNWEDALRECIEELKGLI